MILRNHDPGLYFSVIYVPHRTLPPRPEPKTPVSRSTTFLAALEVRLVRPLHRPGVSEAPLLSRNKRGRPPKGEDRQDGFHVDHVVLS